MILRTLAKSITCMYYVEGTMRIQCYESTVFGNQWKNIIHYNKQLTLQRVNKKKP